MLDLVLLPVAFGSYFVILFYANKRGKMEYYTKHLNKDDSA